jgi:hypothetical protein
MVILKLYRLLFRGRDSSFGIATGYGLEGGGVGVRIPVGQECSLLHAIHTESGVHPTSYTTGTGDFFFGGIAVGA